MSNYFKSSIQHFINLNARTIFFGEDFDTTYFPSFYLEKLDISACIRLKLHFLLECKIKLEGAAQYTLISSLINSLTIAIICKYAKWDGLLKINYCERLCPRS